jgi:hypothetical protein
MSRFKRVAVVTLSLGLVGALLGALLGTLASVLLLAVGVGGVRPVVAGNRGEVLGLSAALGSALGFVLAPVAAWTLMRHVPIWRAIVETSVGTMAGLLLGFALSRPTRIGVMLPIILGLVGFVAAATRLRLANRARPAVNDA